MIDLLPDGVVVSDGDGIVVAINSAAATMLGGGEVGGSLAATLCLQDHDGRSWVGYNRPFDGLNIRSGVPEQAWLLPDGQEVLVDARITRVAPGGAISHVGIVLRSGRGRARLDRERSDLVATVAHELRSPLTGVKGFVQALLNKWDKLNDDQKKLMLTTVHSDSDRLARLIAELLDVARIDTGRLALYPRASDLGRLVERAADTVRAGTARSIAVSLEPGLGEVVLDPDKVTQILVNLIENGVRHGDGEVRVGVFAIPGARVRIEVEDDGDGVAPQIRGRVFTKFWKHGERGGSGLGLYIVGGLVRAHGGTVSVGESSSGGALVRIDLPVHGSAG
ncbi:PAS domain-containing sensor histidine kinase [Nocardioides dubius]|uniref:histidine kinase n=1 Tax=Nocardioides dubius TaxID=317019 RepID=A0ABN1TPK4_9ACTN